ncbi:MAG: WD40 repeat domain-containing protein [Acidobacteriaceae bacterium]|nr:WD40 repeat domain-containing protein [Acidobacteriaceae bacterium]
MLFAVLSSVLALSTSYPQQPTTGEPELFLQDVSSADSYPYKLSENGKLLLSGDDPFSQHEASSSGADVWYTDRGMIVRNFVFGRTPASAAALSSREQRIAVVFQDANGASVKVWDLKGGSEVKSHILDLKSNPFAVALRVHGKEHITDLCFSPDDQWLGALDRLGGVFVIPQKSRAQGMYLEPAKPPILGVAELPTSAFSPDGRWLATTTGGVWSQFGTCRLGRR